MRIVSLDRKKGVVELQLEGPEDLYYLALLVRKGDIVCGWTWRQLRVERGLRTIRGERVRVYLCIKLEHVEFHRFTEKLRLRGQIVEAPESLHAKGAYHTLSVGEGDTIKISKGRPLTRLELKLIEEASVHTKRALLISVDVEEAAIAVLRPQGLEVKIKLTYPLSRRETKSLKSHLEKALKSVASAAREVLANVNAELVLILASTLTLECCREVLLPVLNDFATIKIVKVSIGGLEGLYEALRSQEIRKVINDLRIAREFEYVEKLIKELGGQGRVALGLAEVGKALEWGVVKELLILDDLVLSEEEALSVVQHAAEHGIPFIIITSESEAGDTLKRLGGVAAILYYRPGDSHAEG